MADGPAVAFLTSARSWRGSGVGFVNIAFGLARLGYAPHVVAGDAEMASRFAGTGLPAHQVALGNTGVVEAWAVAAVLRRIKADVVIVDRPRDLRVASLAAFRRPVSIVNKYNLSRPTPPADLLTRLAYRRVRLTVFVSQALASRVLAASPHMRRRPHQVIHEAVDTDRFRPDSDSAGRFRSSLELGDSTFVLAVGALTPEKRYDFLLDLWARGRAWLPPLLVCGEGRERARLRARAGELGVDVRFLGQLTADELRGAYNAAYCLVHAGMVETFGLSALEAMACGRAVLGAAAGALPEVIGDAGMLAAPDMENEFLDALHTLLRDRDQRGRLEQAARRRAVREFSLETMWEAYGSALRQYCR